MRRAAASIALALGVWACALLAGCAAPGDPTARHPVVPLPVTDLSARQAGSEVILSFTLPTLSADREALAESPSIEIYRAPIAPGVAPDRKTPWRLAYAIPSERVNTYLKDDGRVEFRDPLTPADLANPSGNPLAYMVRTRAVKARASGDSNVFAMRVYPSPAAPPAVRTVVTENAVVVTWGESIPPSGASPGGYRVYRAEIEPGEESSGSRELSQIKLTTPLELLGPSTSTDFTDTHFEFGKTYLYTVRAVAQFSAVPVESADSAPAVVTPRDVFPPAAPRGLESAIIPATAQAPAYVELSWDINSEADLAGYNIYRSDREDTSGTRLNGDLLPSPAFRDISVMPGEQYFYRVSAVDRAGNESAKSSAVQTAVP